MEQKHAPEPDFRIVRSYKRLREEEEVGAETGDADQSLSLEENLTFSDTLVALRIIRAQFPQIDKRKLFRIFKLSTGQDDHAIMLLDDYLSQIKHVMKRMEKKHDDFEVFEWFITNVIDVNWNLASTINSL
uniref:Uncharacterized protein n=1 Tax=Manihot esculenta TaxID=3983 RepID=A0A2C9UNT3_MANES